MMLPMWALDPGEKVIGVGSKEASLLTITVDGVKREWTQEDGIIVWKTVKE